MRVRAFREEFGSVSRADVGGRDLRAQEPPENDARLLQALRARAERLSLRALERRGYRNVQVLDMSAIEEVVAEATTHMLERHTAVLTREDRALLGAEAKREFARVLSDRERGVEASETERRARQVQGLREELARQGALLEAERAKTGGSNLILSPESFQAMEQKIRALFAQLVSNERRLSLAEAGPSAVAGLTELERQVAALLDRLLQGERQRAGGSGGGNVEVLEKRIKKLNAALEATERELRRVAEMKVGDPGIASIYDSVQGLSVGESNYKKKKELLALIFEENLTIKRTKRPRAPLGTTTAAA